MRSRETWLASAPGAADGDRARRWSSASAGCRLAGRPPRAIRRCRATAAPFSGVRVLDMTRVIAGPVCTKFLAAYGAEVLRLDPPGFAEVPALLPETTAGKRTAALDLRVDADRRLFENLVADADVLVTGLRADALAGLGYGDGDADGAQPGADRRLAQRVRVGRSLARPPRVRQPGADVVRDRGGGRCRGRGGRAVSAAGPGSRPRHGLPACRRGGPRADPAAAPGPR